MLSFSSSFTTSLDSPSAETALFYSSPGEDLVLLFFLPDISYENLGTGGTFSFSFTFQSASFAALAFIAF
jgi:hypothetical protein